MERIAPLAHLYQSLFAIKVTQALIYMLFFFFFLTVWFYSKSAAQAQTLVR